MTVKYMESPATGQCALFTENGTTGTWDDPTATRNAPLLSPITFLDKIKFHSDLDHLEVAFAGSLGVVYGSIAGIANPSFLASAYATQAGTTDDLLLTHSLGYLPFALVAVGTNIVWPGMPIPGLSNSDGGARYGTPYVDTSVLRLATQATIGSSTLSGATVTVSWLVFKNPPAGAGTVLYSFDPATGIVTMGLGKFHSDAPYLQVPPSGATFGLFNDRCIDLDNGAPKAWRPDGTTFAPVPSGLKSFLPYLTYAGADLGGETLGNSMAYGGSYGGPATAIQVSAP